VLFVVYNSWSSFLFLSKVHVPPLQVAIVAAPPITAHLILLPAASRSMLALQAKRAATFQLGLIQLLHSVQPASLL
jgi:hypothetical protein